jgi:hypothetical protein
VYFNGTGCTDCLGPGLAAFTLTDTEGGYLAGYMGQDTTPWWQQLLNAGSNIASTVLNKPSYPTYGTPGIIGPGYTPGGYYPPVAPPVSTAGLFPTESNLLPWLLGGGVLLFALSGSRGAGGRRRRPRRR